MFRFGPILVVSYLVSMSYQIIRENIREKYIIVAKMAVSIPQNVNKITPCKFAPGPIRPLPINAPNKPPTSGGMINAPYLNLSVTYRVGKPIPKTKANEKMYQTTVLTRKSEKLPALPLRRAFR